MKVHRIVACMTYDVSCAGWWTWCGIFIWSVSRQDVFRPPFRKMILLFSKHPSVIQVQQLFLKRSSGRGRMPLFARFSWIVMLLEKYLLLVKRCKMWKSRGICAYSLQPWIIKVLGVLCAKNDWVHFELLYFNGLESVLNLCNDGVYLKSVIPLILASAECTLALWCHSIKKIEFQELLVCKDDKVLWFTVSVLQLVDTTFRYVGR